MDRYPNISDHGLIGDLQTAALVATDGTLDWFCCPRFDSPSVFASLLDTERGGHCRIAPDRDDYVTRQLYLPDTAILVTRFMTPDGVGEVHDFMPVIQGAATDRHRLVRNIRVVRGVMRFAIEVQPRFDYGRKPHTLDISEHGALFASPGMELSMHGIAPEGTSMKDAGITPERAGDGLRWTRTLREGQIGGVVLESMGGTPQLVSPQQAQRLADDTARFWRGWLHRSTYTGRWREMVNRSAITLKLLTYAPTGAPVAAPTTGLPEQAGGERNWDYRYTWIRDGSFSIHALLGLGYVEEAAAFGAWLRDRAAEQAGDASGPLKIMYRVDGTSDLVEETLDHFEGWRGSRPVRIGNGAADQLQLDIYGEAVDAIFLADSHGVQQAHQGWTAVRKMMDWLCEQWDQPDEGIWETRGGRRNFTYGRFQTWVALDRAVRLAAARGRPANLTRWTDVRDQVYDQVMERGWNPQVDAFTQHYDTEVLDSSLLLMPLQGFIAPRDPMWLSTLAAMDRELVSDSLVYRYNPAVSPDGLKGDEGTFSLCTFWYVEALAHAGRLEEARLVFEKMHTYANHLGLYSEEIGSTGEQLGNFPQAFSHLSLISAAVDLNHQLDHGPGMVGRALTAR
ncbi:glycoside hydrolase family 15 protein [Kutzneria sp. CA-103260]|uniref:glycoside hydrolase family 15 protein n=1 Tax=Kutzneria sp. CA-103260 TaxID=2802641 RepID=UPI001BAE0252|nr:glycoside hydrolase family 15 protein [Kutzneria sp. CA-103260]QUQ68866.1 glycoside hydrolase family 15 protein [Kutzneria sp. CA-103260]